MAIIILSLLLSLYLSDVFWSCVDHSPRVTFLTPTDINIKPLLQRAPLCSHAICTHEYTLYALEHNNTLPCIFCWTARFLCTKIQYGHFHIRLQCVSEQCQLWDFHALVPHNFLVLVFSVPVLSGYWVLMRSLLHYGIKYACHTHTQKGMSLKSYFPCCSLPSHILCDVLHVAVYQSLLPT